MAGNFSGNDSALQIGQETTWGTSVTPILPLEFLSESLSNNVSLIEENALVGAKTSHGVTKGTETVEGDIQIEVNPLNIGLLLGLTLGSEASASEVDTGVYDHVFTAISSGTSLPHFSALVDRKDDVYTFVSNKVNQMSLECSPDGLLTATLSLRGRNEAVGDSLASLSYSTIRPFTFQNLSVKFGTAGTTPSGSASTDVTNFSFTYNNNLEDAIHVADGTSYSAEFDYQKREMNFNLDVLLSTTTSGFRTSNYATGTPISVIAQFVSPSAIDTGYYYTLSVEMLNGYIMEDPSFVVAGPERISGSFNIKASEQDGDEPVTITLRDAQATEYLA